MVDSNPPFVPEDYTTHKARTEWFAQRASYPMRDADPRNLEAFYARRRNVPGPEREWNCMGPTNVGGRVTALVADPDSNILYAGTASGGVWKSDSGGRRWTTDWPQWFTANIGSLAMDPRRPEVLYCGTGEANFSGDDYPGCGVFISETAGKSWRVLAGAAECGLPRRIGAIAVNPHEASGKVLFLGGISHDDTMAAGLFGSTDGGLSWRREDFFSAENYQCTSIAFHPEGLVFATIMARGARSGIWRRSERGWEQLTRGLPPADQVGRISLAVAPSLPDTIYAIVGDWRGKDVLGVFCSRNKGERWRQIDSGALAAATLASYNNAIAVSPEDPDLVACAGNDLFLTRNAGRSWVRASRWNDPPASCHYAHADVHAIVLPGGAFPQRIYSGTDGGVFVTEDLGGHWEPRNQDMVTTLFYSLAVAPGNSGIIGGGTQDNGMLLTGLDASVAGGEFATVQSGDGAWIVIDPMQDAHIFASNSEFRIARFKGDGEWRPVVPEKMTAEERKQIPIARMAMDPEPEPGSKTVWTASRRMWRTHNSGRHWRPVSPFFDGSGVTAIDVADANQRILVGTSRGGIFRSLDGGATWSGNLAGPEIPSRLISDFVTHPESAKTIVAAVAGSGVVGRLMPGAPDSPVKRLRHVFLSEDAGRTWRPIDSAEMPDVACHAAAFETHPPHRLFVSNDCGVWATADYQHWSDWTGNLPTVRVTMLVYHEKDRVLTAATYGRGIWRIPVGAAETDPNKTS